MALKGSQTAMDSQSKIMEAGPLADKLDLFRQAGKIVVFTNGCFDLLHVGHVRYLTAAKEEGDVLVVGLNSDVSIQLIKGRQRPIVEQAQRAEILASLQIVDYVTFFDEPDPLTLIQRLKPAVLVKGADWNADDIIGGDFVKSRGGRVVRVPLAKGISSSNIIKKITKRYC
jgi:D-beta-D-heptose 7-phosphate kinase/D-beta-D-heptose 1-phosphate adenosyltransferase